MRYVCDNCGEVYDDKDKLKVPNSDTLWLRLDSGGTVPCGECPMCTAFVYEEVVRLEGLNVDDLQDMVDAEGLDISKEELAHLLSSMTPMVEEIATHYVNQAARAALTSYANLKKGIDGCRKPDVRHVGHDTLVSVSVAFEEFITEVVNANFGGDVLATRHQLRDSDAKDMYVCDVHVFLASKAEGDEE